MSDEDVIYGWFAHHDTLAVVPAADAEARVQAIEGVLAATTYGQLREVLARDGGAHLPVSEEEFFEDHVDDEKDTSDDAPFERDDFPGLADGDWPQMPSQTTLERLPPAVVEDLRSTAGAVSDATAFNGDFLVIPAAAEQALVQVLERHGLAPRRDDELIHRLAGGDALWT